VSVALTLHPISRLGQHLDRKQARQLPGQREQLQTRRARCHGVEERNCR
jgi:hypothetical protein